MCHSSLSLKRFILQSSTELHTQGQGKNKNKENNSGTQQELSRKKKHTHTQLGDFVVVVSILN